MPAERVQDAGPDRLHQEDAESAVFRSRGLKDEEIDTSEARSLDESFFAEAEIRMPTAKSSITIRLDPDVLEWFKSQGSGYQTRINSVLRRYVEAQKSKA